VRVFCALECGVRGVKEVVMLRVSSPRVAAGLLAWSVGISAPAAAQSDNAAERPIKVSVVSSAPSRVVPGGNDAAQNAQAPLTVAPPRQHRPAPLVPLYASYASLQALDIHSTIRALQRGAVETNPVMKGIVAHEVGLIAVKAASGVAVIYATEKMWKKNRTAAVVLMVAANSAMGWVVQHNYRAVR
jgi:hypothetical protein